ncbi:transmembrane protein 134 [Spea bombifrons]|uniref:transmembrane protein 134 n=1 Tax=Spea bombifrons TaxID=233779 RepID=UPI00234AC7CD|nr:transmembrane protein 134 [Spea bombifrons]XP_053305825.1 transmembrane protein 134 [Spea bombifrons]XP_053305826.1 transmembrane protein 134 [Spea bombifrons]
MGNFSIDDAFEMSIEDTGPRFGALHFNGDIDAQQNTHKYKNLENDDDLDHMKVKDTERGLPTLSSRSSQCSFSTLSNSTQLSSQECFSWTRHPLVKKNKKVVISSFLLLLLGLVFVFVGVGLQVSPSPAISSAIFFVPGLLLLIPGVYHVIFIYCAVRGRHGFQLFYLPYFDK